MNEAEPGEAASEVKALYRCRAAKSKTKQEQKKKKRM
jgi:hypothetical protein